MPKIIEYPNATLKKALQLAKTVDDLGGSCDKKTCAEKLGKKIGGGFLVLIGAGAKFGFVKMRKGTITLEQAYKDYKLAYTEEEKVEHLRKAFMRIPLYKNIYDKYKDVKLPTELLSKVLVREFGVDEKDSSRVAGYFIDGSKQLKLLNPDNSFNSLDMKNDEDELNTNEKDIDENNMELPNKTDNYVVTIKGPNINQTIEIEESDHVMLVEAAMEIIKKKLSKKEKDEDTESTDQSNQ